jgi:hypothetical protein
MKKTWNQKTVSILYIPNKELEDQIKPIVREWTQEGLLDSFLLVSATDVMKKNNEPLEIRGWICFNKDGEMQEFNVNVQEQLAQLEFKIVRLVVLNVITPDNKYASSDPEILRDLISGITQALPLASAGVEINNQATRFMKMHLLLLPSEFEQEGHADLFSNIFNFNIVVSPEDRATPWSGGAQVKIDKRFLRFVMMNVASAGGLWSGMNSSPFDSVPTEHLHGGEAWIFRNFVSTVITEGIARRTAAKVLEGIAMATQDLYDANIAIRVAGTNVIPNDSTDKWLDWMVGKVFEIENGALRFQKPPSGNPPQKLLWREIEQIVNFLKFSWDKTKVIPWWMYVFFRRIIGKRMNVAFQGEKGLAEVGISQTDPLDLRDRQLLERILEIRSQTENATNALKLNEITVQSTATPKLWSSIRKLVFGMLDGSNLEEFGITEVENRVPVFARTNQVIADPAISIDIPILLRRNPEEKKLSWENDELKEIYLKELSEKRSSLMTRKDLVTRQNQLVVEELDRLRGGN